jgi:hypothetical protein
MLLDIHSILDQTALIPIIVLCWAIKYTPKRIVCHPFIAVLIIKELAEIATFILIKSYHASNAIPYNILYTAEAFLFTLQFKKWGIFDNNIKLYKFILISLAVFWIFDHFIIHSFTTFNIYFRLYYCFVLTLIAVYQINLLTVNSNNPLYNNSVGIICTGIILLFTYNIIYEVIFRMGLYNKKYIEYAIKTDEVMAYVNATANLLFAWAMFNLPTKKDFRMPLNH